VLAPTIDAFRSRHIDRRGAEADPVRGLARQQQVGCTEKSRDKARGRARIEFVGWRGLQQSAEIHDADAIGERERLC